MFDGVISRIGEHLGGSETDGGTNLGGDSEWSSFHPAGKGKAEGRGKQLSITESINNNNNRLLVY